MGRYTIRGGKGLYIFFDDEPFLGSWDLIPQQVSVDTNWVFSSKNGISLFSFHLPYTFSEVCIV
jgi:hypothetical protein